MLVNKRYKFLFVHIQKTAGSSICDNLQELRGTKYLGRQHSFLSHYKIPGGYFKFAFVRNPWERLVSWYNMMTYRKVHNDFSAYLLANANNFSEFLDCTDIIVETKDTFKMDKVDYVKSIAFNQLDYLTDRDGKIGVDFIGRFESLQDDYNKVMKAIGLPGKNLKHINKYDRDDYRKYYTEEDIEKVKCLYKRDIEYFKYTF
jgi:hypothetical protein